MNTFKTLTKTLLALFVFSFLAPASLAAGDFNEGFAVMPKNPNVINQNRFIFELAPGESVTDEVLIKNNSGKTEAFTVYSMSESDMSKWIKIDSPTVSVKADSYEIVPFTLSVPQTADLNDYRASIAIEKSGNASTGLIVKSRILLGADLKVTETPDPPKKLFKEASFLERVNPVHLTLAIVLFLLSGGYLLFVQLKGKK